MRKFALLLTIGLFLSASTAMACDGDKTTKTKGKKHHCTCTHKASTTAAKASCAAGATAKASKGCCNGAAAAGSHCCQPKAEKS